jgi:hypothetical protein
MQVLRAGAACRCWFLPAPLPAQLPIAPSPGLLPFGPSRSLPPAHAPAALPWCPQNPAMSVAKNHHQIILRAADAAEKYEWLARLRNASDSRGGVGRAPPLSATSQQLAAGQAPGSASRRSTTGSAGSESPAPPPKDRVGALAVLLCCCPLLLPLRWLVWSELPPPASRWHGLLLTGCSASLPASLRRLAAAFMPAFGACRACLGARWTR